MPLRFLLAADPMCSWCYGFSHVLMQALKPWPELPLDIHVAGLWAGGRDVLDDAGKRFRLQNWSRVQAATGLPFNREALMARQGFVYDTEPISRAFVAGRVLAPHARPLPLFHTLQRAFYVEGLDTTDEEVLQQVLARALSDHGVMVPATEIDATLRSHAVEQTTRKHFATVRGWGLNSFPQLLSWQDGQVRVLLSGFAPAAEIRRVIENHWPAPV